MNYKSYSPAKSGTERGYKSLAVYQQAEIVYDFTVEFCQLYIDKGYKHYKGYKSYSRQSDQMIQAARSGKQNIVEGFAQKSYEGRLKLLSVARASLEELLNDYQDFLRQKNLLLWPKDSPQAKTVRALAYNDYKSYSSYSGYIKKGPEESANAAVCLINQTNMLLDKKYRWEEEKFTREGGFRENLFRKRQAFRKGQSLAL